MGDIMVVDGLAEFFGAVNVAGDFEVFFNFAFEAFRVVFMAKFAGGIVAIFLKPIELAIETAKGVNGERKFFGVGGQLFASVWLEEELGELGGGELNADFGELGGVIGAEMFDEVVLEEAGFDGAILRDAPVAIAAAGFPVRNVALGGCDTVFGERVGDFGMGDVVTEHAIDHVADGVGKASDFASAGFGCGGAGRVGTLGA